MYAQRNPRWEDFDYTYLDEMGGNPMTWLGNGYTVADYDGSSRTTYLDANVIDYPPIPGAEDEKAKVKDSNVVRVNSISGANRINGSVQKKIEEKIDVAVLAATTAA